MYYIRGLPLCEAIAPAADVSTPGLSASLRDGNQPRGPRVLRLLLITLCLSPALPTPNTFPQEGNGTGTSGLQRGEGAKLPS